MIDKIIGYGDNLKITEDGELWMAVPAIRDRVNIMMDNSVLLRKAIINSRIFGNVYNYLVNRSYVGGLKIDPAKGKVLDYLFGKGDRINFITSMIERGRKVYFSSIQHNVIGVLDYL